MKVTGLETQRSSVPKVCRDTMLECFRLIFKEDQEGLISYISEFKEKFFNMEFLEVGKPTSVKNLEKYFDHNSLYKKATPIHVRGSLIYNSMIEKMGLDKKYERIYNFDKVKIAYLKKENPTRENVIAIKGNPPPEFEIDKFIDYEIQWEKNFLEPIKHVCQAIGWQVEKFGDLNELFP